MAGIDLKKWLDSSIGQREAIQSKFSGGPKEVQEKSESKNVWIRKVKTGIDRAFVQLLGSKEVSRAVLMSHKQEVNRILDDMVSV